jgi:chromosomal replication initiator protein
MVKDYQAVWSGCLRTIQKNVNVQSFKTWFEPIKPVRLENEVLTIQVPNKFFYEWLEDNYVALLRMSIHRELGEVGRLEYQVLMSRPAADKTRPFSNAAMLHNGNMTATATMNATTTARPTIANTAALLAKKQENDNNALIQQTLKADQIKNPFVIPGIRKVKIDSFLNTNYRFDNFIEGDCNRLARSAGLAVAKKPGGTAFNPLFLFGNVGLGKTHLAQAIGNDIIRNFEDKNVLYVSCEKFTNQIIDAIKNGSINDIVNFYQLIDVLVVDDIQFLAGKQKTQEIFFHIFNQLHQTGKQLILTCDRPPKDLEGIEDRLISRFKWGLSADLSMPDFETRMAILGSKVEKEGLIVSNEVAECICYNIKGNIRELEGVMVSLIAQSALNQKQIDIALTKDVINNLVAQVNREITIDFIKTMVCEALAIPVEKLQGKTRKRNVVVARQLSMYMAKNFTAKSLKGIGEAFGGRDHSTVIHSNKAIQDLMDTDATFKAKVQEIEKRIRMSTGSH